MAADTTTGPVPDRSDASPKACSARRDRLAAMFDDGAPIEPCPILVELFNRPRRITVES